MLIATRVARAVLASFGLILSIFVFTPVTEWIARPLYLTPASSTEKVDAIVVLEAWATDDGELNESGMSRVLRAADWYQAGAAGTVVVTGLTSTAERTNSALVPMADLLARLGVPRNAILLEGSSSNTHESAVHVARLARERGWSRIALVTDFEHMPRASMSFRRAGLEEIVRAPTLWSRLGAAQPTFRFTRIGLLAHEYGGLLYYWWRRWV